MIRWTAMLGALALATTAQAQPADMAAFKTGPVFEDFGPHAPVQGVDTLPADSAFSVAFDVKDPAAEGAKSRGFESAARFINMHVAHGVAEENIRIAVVVHGRAVHDLLTDGGRNKRGMGATNPSGDMVRAMLDQGVRFIVCGQSAAALDVTRDELIPGVELALSAMTAHSVLQGEGYTVNPF